MVDAVVEAAKEGYAIVSFGSPFKQFASVSVNDFNVRDSSTTHQLPISSKHKLAVASLPAPDSGKIVNFSSVSKAAFWKSL